MELDAGSWATIALFAAIILALAWRRWFGPSSGSSSFETDCEGGDGGDSGGDGGGD